MSQTDDLVERVVEALESLQTAVLDQSEAAQRSGCLRGQLTEVSRSPTGEQAPTRGAGTARVPACAPRHVELTTGSASPGDAFGMRRQTLPTPLSGGPCRRRGALARVQTARELRDLHGGRRGAWPGDGREHAIRPQPGPHRSVDCARTTRRRPGRRTAICADGERCFTRCSPSRASQRGRRRVCQSRKGRGPAWIRSCRHRNGSRSNARESPRANPFRAPGVQHAPSKSPGGTGGAG